MKTLSIAISLLLASSFGASALTVNSTAGNLKEAVTSPAEVTTLTVTGELNVLDFEFISGEMKQLSSLNLAGAAVSAYEGAATLTGRTSAPANTLPECALMLPKLHTLVLPSGLEAIADGALGGSGITSITVPASVTSIGAGAFGNCDALESITLPASVVEIGTSAFMDCAALTSATVQGDVKVVPASAFMGCGKLSSVSLPASVVEIGANAFNGCVALVSFKFPLSLEKIGSKAFYKTSLAEADMNACEALTTIGSWAFADCSNLAEVKFGPEVATIGAGGFYNDGDLPVSELPAGVTKLSDFALRGTAGAPGDFLAGSQVDSIGAYAIANWSDVQSLTLPATLEHIGDGAMANWTALSEITAKDVESVPTLGDDVWRGVDQQSVTLTVPQNLVDEYTSTPQWKEFTVVGDTTANEEIVVEPAAGGDGGLTARFEGMTLIVESAGAAVDAVRVFDVQGRSYSLPTVADTHRVTLDTSAWNARVLIVNVLLADGSAAALKLSRP